MIVDAAFRVAAGRDDAQALHRATLAALGAIARSGAVPLAFCTMPGTRRLLFVAGTDRHTRETIQRLRRTFAGQARDVEVPGVQVVSDGSGAFERAAAIHSLPVDAGHVADPVAWPWSSHRDVLGLRTASWFEPLPAFRERADWLHRRAGGSFPLPRPRFDPVRRAWPEEPLAVVAHSVTAALGILPHELGRQRAGSLARRAVLAAATVEGWDRRVVARYLGWTGRHLRRVAHIPPPEAIVAAALGVLHDERLRPRASGWLDVLTTGRLRPLTPVRIPP